MIDPLYEEAVDRKLLHLKQVYCEDSQIRNLQCLGQRAQTAAQLLHKITDNGLALSEDVFALGYFAL